MNRTRTSTLDAFGLRNQRNRIYPALSASDGSTLDLDFTTMGGALDSRFTFSRAGNATYINSSGYVAYNISNLFFDTAWTSITLPAGWNEGINTAGTFTYNGNGTITLSAVSGRAVIIPVSPYVATLIGVPFTISFTVTAVSGSPTLADVVTTNAGTDTFTVNGIARTNSQVLVADDYVTCTSTATSTTQVPRIGIGVLGSLASTKSVTIKNPQANIGSTAQTYTANTSTSTAYYAPRFDHDPTTLAAKGLLIESAATNLLNFSETFATTGGTNNNWADTNLTRTSTNNTSPRNDATALRITASAANGTIISSAAIGTSAERTLSVWLRRVTGTGNIQFTLDNGSTYTTQAITSAWIRYTFTATTASQRVGFRIVTSADAIEIWGTQLELGKGASSYIPTVASQITRAIDSCTFAITPANIGLTLAPPATFVYSANVHAIPTSSYPTIIAFQDSGGTTAVFRSQINSTTSNYVTWLPTGVATNQATEITFSTLAQGVNFKLATSITSTFVTASRNGVAATPVAVGATYSFVTPDKIVIGILASNVAFTIANFKFFPSAKSQTELNALTT